MNTKPIKKFARKAAGFIGKEVSGTLDAMSAEPKMWLRKTKQAYKNLPENLRGLNK